MARRKTHEEFVQDVYNKVGSDYTVISEYESARKKVLMRHNNSECGNYEWLAQPNDFLSKGTRCPKCANIGTSKRQKKTTEQYKKDVKERVGDEYIVLSEYKSSMENVKFKHNVDTCGYVFESRADNFLNGSRCPKCNGGIKNRNTEIFAQEVKELVGNEYKVIGTYVNNATKIDLIHNVCGNVYNVAPHRFLLGDRCPICSNRNRSKMVSYIEDLLKEKNIEFSREYKYDDCRLTHPLPFDFFIDGKLIEFDGEQHWRGWSDEGRLKQIERDKIKNHFCATNEIPLLRIPYTLSKEEIEKVIKIFVEGNYEELSSYEVMVLTATCNLVADVYKIYEN